MCTAIWVEHNFMGTGPPVDVIFSRLSLPFAEWKEPRARDKRAGKMATRVEHNFMGTSPEVIFLPPSGACYELCVG